MGSHLNNCPTCRADYDECACSDSALLVAWCAIAFCVVLVSLGARLCLA